MTKKPIYDLMLCADGATRAVPVINGVKVDPSLEAVKKQEDLEKKEAEKKNQTKIEYPRSNPKSSGRFHFSS